MKVKNIGLRPISIKGKDIKPNQIADIEVKKQDVEALKLEIIEDKPKKSKKGGESK